MEVILSFLLVLIFSAWVIQLKLEIETLEKLMRPAHAPFNKSAQGGDEPFRTVLEHATAVKPIPAPTKASPDGEPTRRKGGVQIWTIDG